MSKIVKLFCFLLFCSFFLSTNSDSLSVKSEQFYSSQNELFKSGFSELIWGYIRQTNFTQQSSCITRLKTVVKDLDEQKSYATSLLEVSGRFPPVFQDATYASLGDYDKCFQVEIPDIGSSPTQYCVLSLAPDKNRIKTDIGLTDDDLDRLYPEEFSERGGIDLTIGSCLPSTCSTQEVKDIVKEAIKGVYWKHNRPIYCERHLSIIEKVYRATFTQKICLIGLIFWLSLLCVAGLYDMKNRGKIDPEKSGLIHYYFSPVQSYQELVKPIEDSRFVAKDRQQFYTFLIVYQFHLFIWPFILRTSSVFANLKALRGAGESILYQPMICGWLSEYMFYIGGRSTIINYTTSVKNLSRYKEYFVLGLVRLLRYSLVILIVVAMDICLPFFGQGPFYGVYSQQQSEVCSKSFIYNLLHATYLLRPEQICLFHTWTMSVEFPLYVLAGIIVCIYYKNKTIGSIVLYCGIILSFIYTIWNFIFNDVQLALAMYPFRISDTLKFFDLHYIRPVSHFWSFFFMLAATLEVNHYRLRVANPAKMRWRIKILEYLLFFNAFATCIVNKFHLPLTPTFKVLLHLYFTTPSLLWCYLKVLVEKDRFIRTLSKVSLNTMLIDLDVNSNVTKSNNNKHLTNTETKGKPRSKTVLQKFHESVFPTVSRLAKGAYFPHATVIFWYLISLKQPLDSMSASFIYHLTVMYIYIFIAGGFFHIMVLNPCEKIFNDFRENYILPLLKESEKEE